MKKAIIISGIVVLIGGGLYYYYRRQIELLSNFTYTLLGIHLGNLSVSNTTFDLELRIQSNSSIEAQITELQVDVYVSEVKVGHIANLTPIIIPAKGYSDLKLTVQVNPGQVAATASPILSEIMKKRDADVLINGYAKVKSSFLTVSVPVSYQTTVKNIFA